MLQFVIYLFFQNYQEELRCSENFIFRFIVEIEVISKIVWNQR